MGQDLKPRFTILLYLVIILALIGLRIFLVKNEQNIRARGEPSEIFPLPNLPLLVTPPRQPPLVKPPSFPPPK